MKEANWIHERWLLLWIYVNVDTLGAKGVPFPTYCILLHLFYPTYQLVILANLFILFI